ncbi:MAG: DUF4115 domain-containing protein [Candidatus Omnitrophica bacterium]|nr:DUF4115 domain-containing protein [Candidatus Omnitrophota bacterium]
MVKLKNKGIGDANIENSLDTIGERLRSARESKGLSLEDVHKATKIHPRTLEALEKGRLEDKVGVAYVKVFLKSYAAYLGMDARHIVEEYTSGKKHAAEKHATERRPLTESNVRKKEQVPKKKSSPQKSNPELTRAVTSILVSVIIFLVIIFGLIKVGQYAKGVVAAIKTRSAAAKKTGTAKETPKVSRKNEASESAVKEIIPIPKQDKLTLTITASTDVWLKVMLDGEVAFHKTLSKKSKETWKAAKEIRLLEIGKPEALKLIVNGKDIDFSKNRLSRNVLITREGVDFEPQ